MKTSLQNTEENLINMFRARFPLLYITTWEEDRAVKIIKEVVNNKEIFKNPKNLYIWSQTQSLVLNGVVVDENLSQPVQLLEFIGKCEEPAIFVLKDFHIYLSANSRNYDYSIIRKIRDIIPLIKNGISPKSIIIISPLLSLPNELQKDITIVDLDFPGALEIRGVLDEIVEVNKTGRIRIDLDENAKEKLCKAALGLTLQEAENAFAKAMVRDEVFNIEDLDVVLEEKSQIIRKTGILEYIKTDIKIEDVGGLENLKRWLLKRSKAWDNEAKKYNIPSPKGVLITGVPGCGKSLIAKSISAMWKMPLLRLDMGSLFSSLLGSSEENMRKAIKTAEAIAPSILWIDEIEKGFSGISSSNDSGVSARIFGAFLTWMQEKSTPVFVIATANNISSLPAEFLRKGRFDEIFFVDIPTKEERKNIFKVHLTKRLMNGEIQHKVAIDNDVLEVMAELTEGFVGAEIEQITISALFEAFNENRGVEIEDFEKVIKNTVPLSITQSETIMAIREWANIRAVAATTLEDRNKYVEKRNTSSMQLLQDDINKSRGGRTIEF